MFFVFLKQSINFFLYDRAKIVHEALQIGDWRLTFLRWSVWLTIAFGVHLFFAWSFFLNFFGRVSVDGDCIYWTKYPEVIIAFAASDAFLNFCMLLLFAIPLYLQMRKSSSLQTKATEKVRNLMRKNMLLSMFVVCIDIAMLSTMAFFFISSDAFDTTQEHRILWGNFAAVTDQLCVVVGVHAMTGGWIPLTVRKRFRQFKLRRYKQVAEFDSLTVINERT
jgi:hypothetical protein